MPNSSSSPSSQILSHESTNEIPDMPIRRTPTINQDVFHLQDPQPVVYDFTCLSTDGLKITIPPNSHWTSERHWHLVSSSCGDIFGISGSYLFTDGVITVKASGNTYGNGRMHVQKIEPGDWFWWRRRPDEGLLYEAVTVGYRFESSKMYAFYRQICGVTLDAELYFELASTPAWLRLWWWSWKYVPWLGKKIRKWAVSKALWVQLRVVYEKNDYWAYEGRIPFTLPWTPFDPPPKNLVDRELRSVVMISKWVRKSCFWIGTRLLGMKEEYSEYKSAGEAEVREDEEVGEKDAEQGDEEIEKLIDL